MQPQNPLESEIFRGFLSVMKDISVKEGQTQKCGKITLPRIQICRHEIEKLEVFVSHSWIILTQAY